MKWSYRVKSVNPNACPAETLGAQHTNEVRLMRLISACAALHVAGIFKVAEESQA